MHGSLKNYHKNDLFTNKFWVYTFHIDSRLRTRVTVWYKKKFATLEDAEIHYGLTLSGSLAELVIDKRKANSRKSKTVMKLESS